jgi:hypothetical protein
MTTFTPIPFSSPPPAPFLPPTSHHATAKTAGLMTVQEENRRLVQTMTELANWLFDGDCDADEVFNDYVDGIEAMEAMNNGND